MMPFSDLARMIDPHHRQHEAGGDDEIMGMPKIVTGRNLVDYVHPQSNTTLADVPGLKVALAANSVYQFSTRIMYHSGVTPDFRWSLIVPSGTTGLVWTTYKIAGAYTSFGGYADALTNVRADGDGVGYANALQVYLTGTCVTTVGGLMQIQAAQWASDASDTTVMAGSSILAVKIG